MAIDRRLGYGRIRLNFDWGTEEISADWRKTMKMLHSGQRSVMFGLAILGCMAVPALGATLPTLNPSVIDTSKYTFTQFASGVQFPHSMLQLSDGSFLVSSSLPTAG